jgi:hypothetical protein
VQLTIEAVEQDKFVSTMNDDQKLIRTMKRDHAKLLKQFDEAIKQASVGTGTHTRLLEAKSKANERHRAELVRFGVVAENLGATSRTEFLYVSHVTGIQRNRADVQKALEERDRKTTEGLYDSPHDEAIREELEKEYPTK